jgi:hypothetical protein
MQYAVFIVCVFVVAGCLLLVDIVLENEPLIMLVESFSVSNVSYISKVFESAIVLCAIFINIIEHLFRILADY